MEPVDTTLPGSPPSSANRVRGWVDFKDPASRVLIVLLVLSIAVFGGLAPGAFFSANTVRSIGFQLPELGILALAMMLPLVSGGLNLAIVATTNLCALVMAAILTHLLGPSSSLWTVAAVAAVALCAGLLVALVVGLLTGAIIAGLRVHAILVTLGMMILVRGVSIAATHGSVIGGFPPAVLFLGNGTLLGLPVSMVIFLTCAWVVWLALNHTPFGVKVRMIGSNEAATRYSGVDTTRILIGVYLFSSLLCWIAAIIMMARFNSARAGYAESYLLVTILAAVLGGVSPFGGFGRVGGVLLSLLLLQVISTGFNLLGFTPHLTEAIWGATMILALFISYLRTRARDVARRKH